ncbi:hypothetical protein CFOL_v3_16972 [Cephalotus follicularis]|uniref:Uncharacterized protein n=1 Tax=Cephalotus follicularis TaxID=3775 RepID=A0A1Q3BZU5_CEPFO|nr:hypothetical protein CFOL_v3_16972 [Cephalotus follicularis]
MEDTTNLHDLEDFEDTLSLSDLPIHNQEPYPEYQSSPSNQELFEFSIDTNPEANLKVDNIIFCGKIIPQRNEPTNHINDHSSSLHVVTSNYKPHRYHSCNSNKHKFLIGSAKVPWEMQLSDIKKRQKRRAPTPMFPVVTTEREVVNGHREAVGSGCWGLLRPLKFRSNIVRALAKAYLGCIPRV